MKRKICIVLFVFFCLFMNGNAQIARAESAEKNYRNMVEILNQCVGEEINFYRELWIDHLLSAIEENSEMELIPGHKPVGEVKSRDDVILGSPSFIFNPEKEYQYISVQYPLIVQGEILQMEDLVRNTGQWVSTGGEIFVDESCLTKIDWEKDMPIFYVGGNVGYERVIYMETKDKILEYTDYPEYMGEISVSPEQERFCALSYEEKLEYMVKHMENFGEEDPNAEAYDGPIRDMDAGIVGQDENFKKITGVLREKTGERAEADKQEWIDLLLSDDSMHGEDFPVSVKSSEVTLGTPFFYFHPDAEFQGGTVFYPLMEKNRVLGVLTMINENGEWRTNGVHGTEGLYGILNRLNYERECPVFYSIGDTNDVIVMETSGKRYDFLGETEAEDFHTEFLKLSYEDKLSYMARRMEDFGKEDISVQKSTVGKGMLMGEGSDGDRKGISWAVPAGVIGLGLLGVIFILIMRKKKGNA